MGNLNRKIEELKGKKNEKERRYPGPQLPD